MLGTRLALTSPPLADLLATPVLLIALALLGTVDLRERRLPDRLTLPLAALGLALGGWRTGGWPADEVLGAVAGFSTFWALGVAHHRLRGTEGLGLGDAKLLGAAGAWLGWQDLPKLVLLAAIAALAWVAIARRRGPLPFGPWLAAALLALWLARLAGVGPATFPLPGA